MLQLRLSLACLLLGALSLTASAHGPTPQKVDETIEIAAPPAKVWELVKDFGAISSWSPAVTKSEGTGGNGTGAHAHHHAQVGRRVAGRARLLQRAGDDLPLPAVEGEDRRLAGQLLHGGAEGRAGRGWRQQGELGRTLLPRRHRQRAGARQERCRGDQGDEGIHRRRARRASRRRRRQSSRWASAAGSPVSLRRCLRVRRAGGRRRVLRVRVEPGRRHGERHRHGNRHGGGEHSRCLRAGQHRRRSRREDALRDPSGTRRNLRHRCRPARGRALAQGRRHAVRHRRRPRRHAVRQRLEQQHGLRDRPGIRRAPAARSTSAARRPASSPAPAARSIFVANRESEFDLDPQRRDAWPSSRRSPSAVRRSR